VSKKETAMRCHPVGLVVTLALSMLVASLAAGAQPAGKVPRIGWLQLNAPPTEPRPSIEAFREGLRALGWVEGQNIAIEHRWAEGRLDRLPALAAELVRLPVDVLFAGSAEAFNAAKDATTTIPIVFRGVGDVIAGGVVASLARPGGNFTGLSVTTGAELEGKRLQLLKEAVPGVTRVAVLWHPRQVLSWGDTSGGQAVQVAAQALGVQRQVVQAQSPADFEGAFAAMTREGAEALYVHPASMFFMHSQRLMALALERRLPTISWRAQMAEAGGLMAYGPNLADEFRRAAAYVDKILRGAKPGDLPIEQPTKFDLVINLKTAQALGITIPPSLLVFADEVIQ
jgi:putative ABC transport system substrate-binding protein